MKHLIDIINEGNIDRIERKYREFVGMLKAYAPGVDVKDICVHKTSKNNWAVYTKDTDGKCKKLFLASFNILDDDVIGNKKIEICTESLNEAKEQYYITFMQYDPDVQAEYEDGDVDDDELHDSMYEADYDYEYFDANNDKEAVRKAEPIIKKFVNKHPEIVAGCVYIDGDIVETIFV